MNRSTSRHARAVAALCMCLPLASCAIPELIGGMAASAKRTGSSEVAAEYDGMPQKSFAVVIAADRAISSEYPGVVPTLARTITGTLRDNLDATGYIPAETVLRYQYQNPSWEAMRPTELAEDLDEVDRLIYVDLQEFRLTDPGNPHTWDGIATAMVGVIEYDGAYREEFAYTKVVSVRFPDQVGVSPLEIPQQAVAEILAKRFCNRVAWLFFDHEEPNAIKY